MGAHLPGTPKRRQPAHRWKHEPGDEVSTRTDDQAKEAILAALHAGPLEKWRIRQAIHETDARIYRLLGELRAVDMVKRIGNVRNRKYALTDWEAGEADVKHPPIITSAMRKPTPPATSWWIGRDRADFREQLDAEIPRMTRSATAKTVKPITVGDAAR